MGSIGAVYPTVSYVFGGIDICVVFMAASFTYKLLLFQSILFGDMTAYVARLARMLRIDLDEPSTPCNHFILKHLEKQPPRLLSDRSV